MYAVRWVDNHVLVGGSKEHLALMLDVKGGKVSSGIIIAGYSGSLEHECVFSLATLSLLTACMC